MTAINLSQYCHGAYTLQHHVEFGNIWVFRRMLNPKTLSQGGRDWLKTVNGAVNPDQLPTIGRHGLAMLNAKETNEVFDHDQLLAARIALGEQIKSVYMLVTPFFTGNNRLVFSAGKNISGQYKSSSTSSYPRSNLTDIKAPSGSIGAKTIKEKALCRNGKIVISTNLRFKPAVANQYTHDIVPAHWSFTNISIIENINTATVLTDDNGFLSSTTSPAAKTYNGMPLYFINGKHLNLNPYINDLQKNSTDMESTMAQALVAYKLHN